MTGSKVKMEGKTWLAPVVLFAAVLAFHLWSLMHYPATFVKVESPS